MRAAGLTEAQIADELLAIEIDYLRTIVQKMGEAGDS
jgi:hypothetical protein